MTVAEIFDEISNLLEANRDTARATAMRAYLRDRFHFYGISSPKRKKLMKPLGAVIRKMTKEDLLLLIDALWSEGHRESQYIGMDLLDRVTKRLEEQDLGRISGYIMNDSWWDTVDHLAAHQIGHLFKQNKLRDRCLQEWLDSENIWLNRTCLLFQLFYRQDTDWELLVACIHRLRHKREFFIQKAIGWALRQYSKTDAQSVTKFIASNDLSNLAEREGLKWVRRNVK